MANKTLPMVANNPFALIQNVTQAQKWEGYVSSNGNGFVFFNTPYSGVRAGFISLINTECLYDWRKQWSPKKHLY